MTDVDPQFAKYEEADRYVQSLGYVRGDPLRQPLAAAKDAQQRYLSYLGALVPATASVRDYSIAGPYGDVPVRIYYPQRALGNTPIIYLRGGGWWAGTLDTSARTMALACNQSGLPVCGIDYRLTPEHSFPVQLNEVVAAVRWLGQSGRTLGLDEGGLIFWGESAGATLAICAAREIRRGTSMNVKGHLLFYGNFAGPTPETRPYSRWVWEKYLGNSGSAVEDAAIAMRGDLEGVQRVWLGVAGEDPLREDSLQLARKLSTAGIAHEIKFYAGMHHGFVNMSRVLVPAREAIADASLAARRFAYPLEEERAMGGAQ